MIPKKVKVAFEGVNRLYTYFDDQYDLAPGRRSLRRRKDVEKTRTGARGVRSERI